jgi:ribosomal protein S18 acetylase RimI-like enzyme
MSADVVLRAVTPSDEAFLLRLYGSTRPEISQFEWGDAEQLAFITMQSQMQTRSYALQHPKAEHSVITYQGQSAGRVIVDRKAACVSLTDIAVLPEFRGKGIATTVIKRLQEEAAHTGRGVELSVERTNANAFKLYRKLGFEVTGESQIHLVMKWSPTTNLVKK